MSLESNNWISREQHKSNNEPKQLFVNEGHQQPRGVLKIPIKQFILPTESTNRFTQTEQPSGYRGNACVDDPKDVMFDPNISQQQQQQQQDQQQQQQQQQHSTQLYSLEKKDAEKTTITEFPFCYNVNVLQKVQQQQGAAGIGGLNGDEKSCYRFDVAQPFTYNYALVNQMSLAAAASTATFKCDVCGLAFAHLSLLNHHKRLHNNTAPSPEHVYPCDICGSTFNQPSELKTHKQNSHSNNSSNNKNKCCTSCGIEVDCSHASKKKSKFLRCENCEDGSERDSGFEGNQEANGEQEDPPKGHHPVKRRGMATVTKCHKCNGSGIIFVGGVQNTVEKPFHCNICDGTFSRYSSLWSHKRLHSGEKPFKCEFCGISFARAAYLKNHGRVHSGERPFKCSVCGMQFSQSPHLKNHERIHSGERPYECEICNKAFARHSTLWNHRRIHTGEKPYRCNVCGSAFNQATHLKNHAKVHTGEKPHRCDICDVAFSDRFALKRHRGVHEKYGQTAPSQQQQQQAMGELYKQCDVGEVIKQNTAQTNQPRIDDIYKCDVTGGIAFPGCSRPPDPK
ncbi:hypothetical protein AAG570_012147 [Ranatra chinensis]|uniref:C2H2-type domain-containing protein n=1 Tax=Ranatra chinensis TaxID=642074 RepID=A0ABD0YHY0_9HEMI